MSSIDILLPGDVRRHDEKMNFDQLEEVLAGRCAGKIIHFGGCNTLSLPPARIRKFLKATRAKSVSGFCSEVDWTESTLFEMTFLLELQKRPLTTKGLRSVRNTMKRLRTTECREMKFLMHLRG